MVFFFECVNGKRVNNMKQFKVPALYTKRDLEVLSIHFPGIISIISILDTIKSSSCDVGALCFSTRHLIDALITGLKVAQSPVVTPLASLATHEYEYYYLHLHLHYISIPVSIAIANPHLEQPLVLIHVYYLHSYSASRRPITWLS